MPARTTQFAVMPLALALVLSAMVALLLPVVSGGSQAAEASAERIAPGPVLNISKIPDQRLVQAGDEIGYTISIWNSGASAAPEASYWENLPLGLSWAIHLENADDDDSCMSAMTSSGEQSVACAFGSLVPSAKDAAKRVRLTAETAADTCGMVRTDSFASATGAERAGPARAPVTVRCQAEAGTAASPPTSPSPAVAGGVAAVLLLCSAAAFARGQARSRPGATSRA